MGCFVANIVNASLIRLNQYNKDCIDFLEYINKNYPSAVKKESDKITEINTEINIQESGFINLICKGISFKQKISFNDCKFKGKVSFKNCTFEKRVTFSNSLFGNRVYFDNSIFKDYVDFHESSFMYITSFYGVTFQKVPNFSASYFKEQKAVNLVNVDINSLDFSKVKKFIDDNYRDKIYDKDIKKNPNKQNTLEQKHKLRYAQNVKDSFRVIKDILIEQNNILEAQKWHKFELYAKENELTIRLNKITKQSSKSHTKQMVNIESQSKVSKDIVDKILFPLECVCNFLCFFVCSVCKFCCTLLTFLFSSISYIFHLFLFISFIIFKIISITFLLFPESEILQLKRSVKHKMLRLNRYGKDMIDYTDFINYAMLHIYRNTSDHHTNFVKILNFTIGMIALYGAISYLFHFCFSFLLYNSIIPFIPIVFFVLIWLVLSLFFIYHSNVYQLYQFSILLFCFWGICFTLSIFLSRYILHIEMLVLYIVSILLCYYIFICKIRLVVFITRLISYLWLFYIIVGYTQLLNPLVGIFSPDKFFESQFEQKLNALDTNTIIKLANISQQEFIPQDKCCEYDISFTELKSAKAIILSNKYNITAIKDEKLAKAKNILGDSLYDEIATSIEQDKILGDIIKSTNTIYVIILLLCIFSLQKTARKNSIIPS